MRLALFIGLFLILGGISTVVDVLFKVHLPLMRILFGVTLIYLGLSLLLRGFHIGQSWLLSDPHSAIFRNMTLTPRIDSQESHEMNLLFSQGVVDLTALHPKEQDIDLKLNVVFANALVRIDPRVPLKIIASAAFAGCQLPEEGPLAFGERTYRSASYKEGAPAVVLHLSTVFGAAEFLRAEGR